MQFKLSVIVVVFCAASLARAETVTLEKPVNTSQQKADKTKFSGKIVSYDEEGFDLAPAKRPKDADADATQRIKWDELDAKTAFVVRKSVIGPKDAAAHVELGRALLGTKGGKEYADKAFAIALKLDATLKGTIEEIKKDAASATPSPTTKKPGGKDADEPPEGMKPPSEDETQHAVGPQTVGGVEEQFWGKLTDEQQAESVTELKGFAAKTQEQMKKELTLQETKYFLFYSDLPKQEAKNWSGLLDRMYAKLGEMFGVEKGVNIWRGKALVFVFSSPSDYARFQVMMHKTDPGGSAGMCHTYGNGLVHIAFYRQPKELDFAHVLVHESVHGFIHRYKTPVHVPSWINEGLAEWIATQLLIDKRPTRPNEVRYTAQYWLRQHGGMGGFFEADHIEGWQYPVAEMLTTYMIEQSRKGYVDFVNGVKEGMSWDEALTKRFKAPRERLVPAFAAAMKVKISG